MFKIRVKEVNGQVEVLSIEGQGFCSADKAILDAHGVDYPWTVNISKTFLKYRWSESGISTGEIYPAATFLELCEKFRKVKRDAKRFLKHHKRAKVRVVEI